MQYRVYQSCSTNGNRMTTSKISTYDGTKHNCQLRNNYRNGLGRLYKSKLQVSVQLQTVLASYDQETVRNNGQQSYSRLKTSVRLHIDQAMTARNVRVRSGIVERGVVTKIQQGKKAYVERKVGECYRWKANGQCSRGDSCSFRHEPVSGNEREAQRRKEQQSCPAHVSKAKTDGEKNQGNTGASSPDKRSRIPCVFINCTDPSCDFRHPPECLNYMSQKGCRFSDRCHFRHVEAEEKPNMKSKKGGAKGQVASLKETRQWAERLKILIRKSLFYGKKENWDHITP